MEFSIDGEPIGTIERLIIEPGDVLVLSSPDHMTALQLARIRDRMLHEFAGHRVLVLGDGLTITPVKPDQIDDPDICPHGRDGLCAACVLDGTPNSPEGG
jgi:hypothetical protein